MLFNIIIGFKLRDCKPTVPLCCSANCGESQMFAFDEILGIEIHYLLFWKYPCQLQLKMPWSGPSAGD